MIFDESSLSMLKNMLPSKAIFSRHTLAASVAVTLLTLGLWECLLGWEQLLGFRSSHHSLYPATGSFFNPGPYCGFLAMIAPFALYYALENDKKVLCWMGIVYLVAALGIMPALMGRTGWIAAVTGCTAVGVGCGSISRPRRWTLIVVIGAAIVAMAFLVWLKPSSALGRLLLWRIGLSSLISSPITAVGWEHVAGLLGDAQEA